MWWAEIQNLAELLAAQIPEGASRIDPSANVEAGATLDHGPGPIVIGPGTRICAGALLRGPIIIGSDSLIGNYVMLRGPTKIGDGVRIGFSTEIKHALIHDRVTIGPLCFVADTRIDHGAYLGALVRTSNHRLDRRPVAVRDGDREISTGLEKLGCWIGARAALGIQVIVLPGRVIAEGSIFEPRVTIARNHAPGRYRVQQVVEQRL